MWVPAHSGFLGNERADIAKKGNQQGNVLIKLSESEGKRMKYWTNGSSNGMKKQKRPR